LRHSMDGLVYSIPLLGGCSANNDLLVKRRVKLDLSIVVSSLHSVLDGLWAVHAWVAGRIGTWLNLA
jgi:hypothetical protein